ncbi:MAG: czcC 2 [Planctomycetaceae bacterium]|nr:czcC 2 [Planctomycetaceae bacterium]
MASQGVYGKCCGSAEITGNTESDGRKLSKTLDKAPSEACGLATLVPVSASEGIGMSWFWRATFCFGRYPSNLSRRLIFSGVVLAGSWNLLYSQDSTAPSAASSETPSDPLENGWTLEAVQSLALSNNPTLVQAAAAADMARGVRQQVGLYPNPQLGYLRKDSSGSGNARTGGAFFGQEIVTAGKIRKAQNAEAWEVERSNWNYQAQCQRVENDIHLRFLDVLAAQDMVQISGSLSQLVERGLHATERLFEAKQVPKSDVLQARIQYRTIQLAARDAEARYRASWKQLMSIAGTPATPLARVIGDLGQELPVLDFDEHYQDLLANSPLVQAARARAQHWQATYVLERANAKPNLNLQLVAERDPVDKFSSLSTLISMPIPVYNRNQGNIYRAAAETRESAAEIQRTELALHDQLADAFRRYEIAKATVETMQNEILPDAEESVQLSLTAYRASEVGILSVLSAQKTLVESRLSRIEALAEGQKTRVEIEGLLLTGALNPAELGTALQSQPGNAQRRAILQRMEGNGRQGLLPAAIQGGP